MKPTPLLMIAGLIVTGCCSTQTDLQRSPTSDLQLRRYDLKHCLSMQRMSWDKQPLQSNGDDMAADLEEKHAIEGEITRRDITNYHRPPPMTNVHGRCHCQCWVVTL